MQVRVLVPRRISACAPDAASPLVKLRGRCMGCGWSATCVMPRELDQAALEAGITAVLGRVVEQMSTWEPDSTISRFNRATSASWLPLPEEFAQVLGCALHVARASGGALDPTAGPLVGLWGFGPAGRHHEAGFREPGPPAIDAALRRCGWPRLTVETGSRIRLHQPGGLELDLSAVAKGFAVDQVSRYLSAAGVADHLVDIGGELRGSGMKPDGQPWWVDVQMPPGMLGVTPTRIALHGLSVATSGDYLQGFSLNGRRYSHCLDPRTGQPISNGVCSVTVVTAQCMQADAWSTALMVLGPEAGMAIAESEQLAAQWLVRSADACIEHCSSAWLALAARRPGAG